jgi:hypothetical protein
MVGRSRGLCHTLRLTASDDIGGTLNLRMPKWSRTHGRHQQDGRAGDLIPRLGGGRR